MIKKLLVAAMTLAMFTSAYANIQSLSPTECPSVATITQHSPTGWTDASILLPFLYKTWQPAQGYQFQQVMLLHTPAKPMALCVYRNTRYPQVSTVAFYVSGDFKPSNATNWGIKDRNTNSCIAGVDSCLFLQYAPGVKS